MLRDPPLRGKGVSAPVMRALVGHESLVTTQRHANVVDSDLEAGIARLRGNKMETGRLPRRVCPTDPANSLVPPGRVELPTNGLGNRRVQLFASLLAA